MKPPHSVMPVPPKDYPEDDPTEGRSPTDTGRYDRAMLEEAKAQAKRGKVWYLLVVWWWRDRRKHLRADRRTRECRGQQWLLALLGVLVAHHLGVPVKDVISLAIALFVSGGGG